MMERQTDYHCTPTDLCGDVVDDQRVLFFCLDRHEVQPHIATELERVVPVGLRQR